jgi:FkbM family methyltransferase
MLDYFLGLLIRSSVPGATRLFTLLRGKGATIRIGIKVKGIDIPLRVCPCDYLDREVIINGYYEQQVLDELLQAPTDSTVWDIGANIGLHSAALAAIRPDLKVVAVEANPLLVNRIVGNIGKYSNITLIAAGLSSTYGTAMLSLNTTGNSGLSSLSPLSNTQYEQLLQIATLPASSLSGAVPTIVKIDVEGHEFEVLSGFGPILHLVHKYIIETSIPDQIHELLGKKIYKCRSLGPAYKRDFVFELINGEQME